MKWVNVNLKWSLFLVYDRAIADLWSRSRSADCINTEFQQAFKFSVEAYLGRCNPAVNYMFKFNNRNTRTRCEICSELTIKTPERRQCGLGNMYDETFCKNSLRLVVISEFWQDLNPLSAIPQNGQTHSNNSTTNCFSMFDHFVGLALKGLKNSKTLLKRYFVEKYTCRLYWF